MNKKFSFPLSFLAVFLILVSASCKVNSDYGFPEIIVTQPLPNTIFEFGDTIQCQAQFADDNQLTNIELLLVDQDNKPVLPVVNYTPPKNPFSLSGDYIISDPMLPTGRYYIRFQASNGKNITNKFVEVQIVELKRELLYPIVVTHPEHDVWNAYRLANNTQWVKYFTQSGDYVGIAVNPSESQFYISGNSISNLTSAKLPVGANLWSVKPVYFHSNNWFGGIVYSYPFLYATCADGCIRGYNKTGNEIYKSEVFHNAEPNLLVATNNFIIGAFADAFSSDRFLVTFHNPGGKMLGNKFLIGDVIGLLQTTGEKILVFSNYEGQGSISQYNATDNSLSFMHPFYTGIFVGAARMDNDNYIISSTSGIYLYQLSNNSLTVLVPGINGAKIVCNTELQQFYACVGKEMQIFDFPNPILLQTIPLPDTIVDVELVFNK